MALLLAGCGAVVKHPTPLLDIVDDSREQERIGYRLQPGDQIEIRFLLDAPYSGNVTIQVDGKMSVPGIRSQVVAAGVTVQSLADRLAYVYDHDAGIKNPTFSVSIRNATPQLLFVGGEVQRPGMFDLGTTSRSVMQVLMAAGGPLATARMDEVIVYRRKQSGAPMVFAVNLRKVLSGEDLTQDVLVHGSDVVVVPKSDIASLDTWVDQYIRQALPFPVSGGVSYTYVPGTNTVQTVSSAATGR